MARNYNPSWDSEMKFLEQKARDTAARIGIRANLHPQAGEIVSHLTTDYPWLPAGVVASMAATGVDPSSPEVTAVARMAYQQKVQSGDWAELGDRILPKQAPEPVPQSVDEAPMLPQPAPEVGSPQADAALLNPTPEPIPPAEAPSGP